MTHIITPAAKPKDTASSLGRARLAQKTTAAPKVVDKPAAITSPKARPTLPVATMPKEKLLSYSPALDLAINSTSARARPFLSQNL